MTADLASPAERVARLGPWQRVGCIVVVGLATGALTQVAQGILPSGWSQAANAISPWLFVAFLLGAVMPDTRWAAVAGIAALLLALVGYYAVVQLRFGYGGGTGSWVFWGLGALVGGPVFGVAGRWWRAGRHRQRAAAIGLVAAVVLAEGIYQAVVNGYTGVGVGFAVVGLAVPLVLGRSRSDRLGGYVAIVPALALGALGYAVFLAVYELTARL